jgi:hypothetical protein
MILAALGRVVEASDEGRGTAEGPLASTRCQALATAAGVDRNETPKRLKAFIKPIA